MHCQQYCFNVHADNTYCTLSFSVKQIQVQAYDAGTPTRSATTYVEVTIIRAQGQLQFTLPSYAITISENKLVNTDVIQTLAQPGVSLDNCLISLQQVHSPIDCLSLTSSSEGRMICSQSTCLSFSVCWTFHCHFALNLISDRCLAWYE